MNKVNLIGRLTKDVELKYSQNEKAWTDFTLAVDRRFTKEGEEKQADFIRCKAFGKTAEFVSKYFHKGKMMAIAGEIRTGSYEKEDGSKVYTTDVFVSDVYFCGSKGDTKQVNEDGSIDVTANEDELPF